MWIKCAIFSGTSFEKWGCNIMQCDYCKNLHAKYQILISINQVCVGNWILLLTVITWIWPLLGQTIRPATDTYKRSEEVTSSKYDKLHAGWPGQKMILQILERLFNDDLMIIKIPTRQNPTCVLLWVYIRRNDFVRTSN